MIEIVLVEGSANVYRCMVPDCATPLILSRDRARTHYQLEFDRWLARAERLRCPCGRGCIGDPDVQFGDRHKLACFFCTAFTGELVNFDTGRDLNTHRVAKHLWSECPDCQTVLFREADLPRHRQTPGCKAKREGVQKRSCHDDALRGVPQSFVSPLLGIGSSTFASEQAVNDHRIAKHHYIPCSQCGEGFPCSHVTQLTGDRELHEEKKEPAAASGGDAADRHSHIASHRRQQSGLSAVGPSVDTYGDIEQNFDEFGLGDTTCADDAPGELLLQFLSAEPLNPTWDAECMELLWGKAAGPSQSGYDAAHHTSTDLDISGGPDRPHTAVASRSHPYRRKSDPTAEEFDLEGALSELGQLTWA